MSSRSKSPHCGRRTSKGPLHLVAVQRTLHAIEPLLPPGWHAVKEEAVRIPNRGGSEPEPDVSIVRGSIDDYTDHHPGAADVALVVEVTRTTAAKDRRLARVYGASGIPVYWIVNVPRRGSRCTPNPAPSAPGYPAPVWLGESESVDLIVDGQVVGQIAVADLLPRRS